LLAPLPVRRYFDSRRIRIEEQPEEEHSYEYIGDHTHTRPPSFCMLIADLVSAL
jgi:hypothetical protein